MCRSPAHEPALPCPWRVGGGCWDVAAAGLPAAVSLAAMATAGVLNTAVGLLAALTGPVAYRVWRGGASAAGGREPA